MILYHRTTRDAADAILKAGFKDMTGNYLTANEYSGVWVSDSPLDSNEGIADNATVLIEIELDEAPIARYEWIEEEKSYREWLIPAEIVNQARIRLAD